jgi:signal transduction histidine kinase
MSRSRPKFEERLAERTRIARDLNDTLRQSFQRAVCQIQVFRNMLLRRADNAMAVLDEAVLAAEGDVTEERAAIRDLRPTGLAAPPSGIARGDGA